MSTNSDDRTASGGLLRIALGLVIVGVALLITAGSLSGGLTALFGAVPAPPSPTPTRTRAPTATLTSAPSVTPTETEPATPTVSPTVAPTDTAVPDPTETAIPDPAETAVPTETPTLAAAVTPTSTVVSTATTLVAAGSVAEFGSAFENRVWVGLYGTPAGRGLGILGTASATETVTMTKQQALAYQVHLTGTQVVPFFHMVTTIADPHPGADGDYVHRVTTSTIQLWIDVARTHGLLSVLDIQPGHSPITTELAYHSPFLQQPGVHLAIDPEFLMLDGVSVPGQRIGTMTGDLVNVVQAWLNGVAETVGERKALIIHQFDDRMFSGKENLVDYPLVDLVWDADGFGGPGAKIGDYNQYAGEPGFEYGGFKLFYDYDVPLMLPEAVLQLEPRPAFVVYQ